MSVASIPKICLAMTTIHSGEVLDGYCRQAEAEGVRDRLRIVVIPDRKTPPALYEKCRELASQGFRLTCPTLQEQESYLKKLGIPPDFIPYDSDNRRNVGFLNYCHESCKRPISPFDTPAVRPEPVEGWAAGCSGRAVESGVLQKPSY